MTTLKNHDVRLARRPSGLPVRDDFELLEGPIPTPGRGQVLVKNLLMSVDPYMRGRMSDRKSYVAPFQIGEVLQGAAIGRVVTGNDQFAAGQYVLSNAGWREWFVSDGRDLSRVGAENLEDHLGVLGMPGFTAWVGLTQIGKLTAEDRVYISAAASAVGSVAVQIAKALGAQIVVGSTSTDDKCDFVRGLGARACINYRSEDSLSEALAGAMPGGIDLYFDNVGGKQLEAALDNMRLNGRVVICGLISQYNASEPPAAPRNLYMVLAKRLTMRGFLVFDHADLRERFLTQMRAWMADGKVKGHTADPIIGLDNAPGALISLFRGDHKGKVIVKIGDDD